MDGLSGLGTSWDVVKSYRTATQSPSQVHRGAHPRQDTKQSQNHLRRSSQAGEMAQLDKHLLEDLSRAPSTHVQSWAQWHMPIDANTREAERGDVTPWISLSSSAFREVPCLKMNIVKSHLERHIMSTSGPQLPATYAPVQTCTGGGVRRGGGERENT